MYPTEYVRAHWQESKFKTDWIPIQETGEYQRCIYVQQPEQEEREDEEELEAAVVVGGGDDNDGAGLDPAASGYYIFSVLEF